MSHNFERQIDELLSNREKFNEFVYTPVEKAILELEARRSDPKLKEYAAPAFNSLPVDMQKVLSTRLSAIYHRSLTSPNYEVIRFISLVDGANLEPVFLEDSKDKFVSVNSSKYHLGRLGFYFGRGKKDGVKMKYEYVIDFQSNDGDKFDEVTTLWGQNLIDFHHELFSVLFPNLLKNIFDGHLWYPSNGGKAKDYYKPFFSLLLSHGILFENFMLDEEELPFTKEIILPAILEILEETGKKPLIVNNEPTNIEGDQFWLSYPENLYPLVKEKCKPVVE